MTPFETNRRPARKVCDDITYKNIYATLPAVRLAAQKVRARNGLPKLIRELWVARDKTFLAVDFKWSERNPSTVLTWGYAAVRCGGLNTWVYGQMVLLSESERDAECLHLKVPTYGPLNQKTTTGQSSVVSLGVMHHTDLRALPDEAIT